MGLVEVSTPGEICRAINDRRQALRLSMLDLDHASGLQSGYSAKLLGPGRIKSLGSMSMGALLGALGLRVAVIPADPLVERGQSIEINGFRPADMGSLLNALGLRLVIVSDDAALPKVTRRLLEGQKFNHVADRATRVDCKPSTPSRAAA